jgi:hypothetical protein
MLSVDEVETAGGYFRVLPAYGILLCTGCGAC